MGREGSGQHHADPAEKGYKRGYGFQTFHMVDFEKDPVRPKSYIYGSCFVHFFNHVSKWMQIQMSMVKEGITFLGIDAHGM